MNCNILDKLRANILEELKGGDINSVTQLVKNYLQRNPLDTNEVLNIFHELNEMVINSTFLAKRFNPELIKYFANYENVNAVVFGRVHNGQNSSYPTDQVETDSEFNSIRVDFLTPYFGIDTLGRDIYLESVTKNLIFKMFFNSNTTTFIKNNIELNDSILNFLKRQYRLISTYIKMHYPTTYKELKGLDLINDQDKIFNLIDPIFKNPNYFGYAITSKFGTVGETSDNSALSAYITLRHFDDIIRDRFDKIISIADKYSNGEITTDIKYRLDPENSNITSWRDDSKDYNELHEIGNLNSIILSVMPNYEYSSEGAVVTIPGSYFSLQRLAKAKSIMQNIQSLNEARNMKLIEPATIEAVLENTIAHFTVNGETLIDPVTIERVIDELLPLSAAETMAKLNDNFRIYAPIVLDILFSNNNLLEKCIPNKDNRNLLLTLYQNIFNPQNNATIPALIRYGMRSNDYEYNYLDFINQSLKTLQENKLISYSYSPEFGLNVNYLTDESAKASFFRLRRQIHAINSIDTKESNPNIEVTTNFEKHYDDSDNLDKSNYEVYITYTLPNGTQHRFDIIATEKSRKGQASVSDLHIEVKSHPNQPGVSLNDIIEMISHFTGIPTETIKKLPAYGIKESDLLNICGTIVYKTEISKFAKSKGENNTVQALAEFIKDLKFPIGQELSVESGSIIELTPTSKRLYPTLVRLANALSSLDHVDPKMTANDTQKKQVGMSGISSLHANLFSQMLRRSSKDPSMKSIGEQDWEGFQFDKMYLGDAMIRDVKNGDLTKSAVTLNFNELYIANFIYDFYGAPLDSQVGSSSFGTDPKSPDTEALFMGMIISDKSNLEKLRIAIHRKCLKIPGKDGLVSIAELSPSDIKELITKDFSKYYLKLRSLINAQCGVLSRAAQEVFGEDAPIFGDNWADPNGKLSFEQWNNFIRNEAIEEQVIRAIRVGNTDLHGKDSDTIRNSSEFKALADEYFTIYEDYESASDKKAYLKTLSEDKEKVITRINSLRKKLHNDYLHKVILRAQKNYIALRAELTTLEKNAAPLEAINQKKAEVEAAKVMMAENLFGNWDKGNSEFAPNKVLEDIISRTEVGEDGRTGWDKFLDEIIDQTLTDLIQQSPKLDVSSTKKDAKAVSVARTQNKDYIRNGCIGYFKIGLVEGVNITDAPAFTPIKITSLEDFINWKTFDRVMEYISPKGKSSKYLTVTQEFIQNNLPYLEKEILEQVKIAGDYSTAAKQVLVQYLDPNQATFNIKTAFEIINTFNDVIRKQSKGAQLIRQIRNNYKSKFDLESLGEYSPELRAYTEDILVDEFLKGYPEYSLEQKTQAEIVRRTALADEKFFKEELKNYFIGVISKNIIDNRMDYYLSIGKTQEEAEALISKFKESLAQEGALEEAIKDYQARAFVSGYEDFLKTGDWSLLQDDYEEMKEELLPYIDIKTDEKGKSIDPFAYLNETPRRYTYTVNPEIARHTLLDHLFFNEHSILSVGSFVNHPGGSRQARVGAQVKRNVVNTGGKQLYDTSNVNGASRTCRIAVFDDQENTVFNTMGKVDSQPGYDGGTFTCGVQSILENISLGNAKVGINKKPLFHGINEFGQGIIIKTAGFDVNNNMIRRSEELARINKRMLGLTWDTDVDVTSDFEGRNLFEGQVGQEFGAYGPIYYYEDGKHWQVTGFKKVSGIQYEITRTQINEDGSDFIEKGHKNIETNTVDIASNYDLWKVFGGAWSEHFEDGKLTYLNDNTSMKQVAIACNRVGYKKSYKGKPYSKVSSQEEVDQVLKRHLICYFVGSGSIKQGALNMNSADVLNDDNYEVSTMEFTLEDGGVQLDAEHHSEDSVLSLMTQVVNALSARGYSTEQAKKVYEALSTLTKLNLKDLFNGLEGYIEHMNTDQQELYKSQFTEAISDIIINTLKHTSATDGNALMAISNAIKAEASKASSKYSLILGKLPISNPSVFNQLMSQIASGLSKAAIKLKPPGVMCVLVPSDGIIKLYDGDLLDQKFAEFGTTDINKVKSELLQKSLNVGTRTIVPIHKINFEANYFLQDESGRFVDLNGQESSKSVRIESPNEYYALRDFMKNQRITLIEDKSVGRNLAASQITFVANHGDLDIDYCIWDLDSVKARYFVEFETHPEQVFTILNAYGFDTDLYYDEEHELTPDNLTDTDALAKWVKRHKNEILKFLQIKHQEELNALGSGIESTVHINGQEHFVYKNDVSIKNYEGIMPKVYSAEFGLRAGDSVAKIKADKNFFYRRLVEEFKGSVSKDHYHLAIRGANRKQHVYLLHSASEVPEGLTKKELHYIVEGNTYYRVNAMNNKLYVIPTTKNAEGVTVPNIEIYEDSNGNEIIRSSNLIHFLDQFNGQYLQISELASNPSVSDAILEELKKSERKAVKSLYNHLTAGLNANNEDYYSLLADRIVTLSTNINNAIDKVLSGKDLDEGVESKFIENMQKTALEMHTSFLKSLEILAARIPSQSQQSFMSMDIVGFDDSGVNNAHVSRWQLWLQGSDFDIDKVSLLGSCFDKGKYVTWSPFMTLENIDLLHAGELLTLPTGRKLLDGKHKVSEYDELGLTTTRNETLNVWNYLDKAFNYKRNYDDGYVTSVSFTFPQYNNLSFDVEIAPTGAIIPEIDFEGIDAYGKFFIINAIGDKVTYPIVSTGETSLLVQESQSELALDKFNKYIESLLDEEEIAYLKSLTDPKIDAKQFENLIEEDKITAIKKFAKIIEIVNKMDYIPFIDDGSTAQEVIKLVDIHNTFKTDMKKATINVVSSNMFQTSKDPVNYIQGQISVDATTKRIKDMAAKLASAMKSKQFDEKTITTRIQQLRLTIEGKQNVGISASSLKVFEGISYYVYKTLNWGTPEEQQALLFNLSIAGIPYHILANAHAKFAGNVDDTPLKIGDYQLSVQQVLENVDSFEDAFIMISTFLSLAADNAKDPTLSKLNAGPDMLGLYTAGVMIGVPIETLIPIITSDTGKLIQKQLSGNIFNEDKGSSKVLDAIDYLGSSKISKGLIPAELDIVESVLNAFSVQVEHKENETPSQRQLHVNSALVNLDSTLQDRVIRAIRSIMHGKGLEEVLASAGVENNPMAIVQTKRSGIQASGYYKNHDKNIKIVNSQIASKKAQLETISKTEDTEDATVKKTIAILEKDIAKLEKKKADIEFNFDKQKSAIDILGEIENKVLAGESLESIVSNELSALQKHSAITDFNNAQAHQNTVIKEYESNQTDANKELVKAAKKAYKEAKKKVEPIQRLIDLLKGLQIGTTQIEANIEKIDELAKDYLKLKKYQASIDDYLEEVSNKKRQIDIIRYDYITDSDGNYVYNADGKRVTAADEITTLAKVGNELTILRQLILNQDLPNSTSEQLSFIRFFENALINAGIDADSDEKIIQEFIKLNTGNGLDSTLMIDTQKWLTDKNYREVVKGVYDTIKQFVNPFRVIDSVEHFRDYLNSAIVLYHVGKTSAQVYRTTDTLMRTLSLDMPIMSSAEKERLAKSIQNFILHKATNSYLASSEFTFKVNSIISHNGEITELKEPAELALVTPEERANFIYYMESVYIPALKSKFPNNALVQNLTRVKDDRNGAHSTVIKYKLAKTSMPKEPSEIRDFQRMKKGLNDLRTSPLPEVPYTPIEMLFLYNLITCDNAPGEFNLTGLFEDLNVIGGFPVLDDFNSFISNLDFEGSFVNGETFSEEELYVYIAPVVTAQQLEQCKYTYAWVKDDTTQSFELFKKISTKKSSQQEEDGGFDDNDPRNDVFDNFDSGIDQDLNISDNNTLLTAESKVSEVNKKLEKSNSSYMWMSVGDTSSPVYTETESIIDSIPITRLQFKGSSLAIEFSGNLDPEKLGTQIIIRYKGSKYTLNDLLINTRFGNLKPEDVIITRDFKTIAIDNKNKSVIVKQIDGKPTLYHLLAILENNELRNTVAFDSLKKITGSSDIHVEAAIRQAMAEKRSLPNPNEVIGSDPKPYINNLLEVIQGETDSYVDLKKLFEYAGQEDPGSKEERQALCELIATQLGKETGVNIDITPIGNMAVLKVIKYPTTYSDNLDPEIRQYLMETNSDGQDDPRTTFSNLMYAAMKRSGVRLNTITTQEIQEKVRAKELPSMNMALVNAFIYNGEIYINLDNAELDAPLHEFSHILFGILKFTNPNTYQRLMEQVMDSMGSVLQDKARTYKNRSQYDVAEEILVDELGKYLAGQVSIFNTKEDSDELFTDIKNGFIDVFNRIADGKLPVENVTKDLNGQTRVLNLLRAVHSDRLSDGNITLLEAASIHRVLGNIKQQLFSSGKLKEKC